MLPKKYSSGSAYHRSYQDWNNLDLFKKIWAILLKISKGKVGINWNWQSIDRISVKASLVGRGLEIILQIGANCEQKDIF